MEAFSDAVFAFAVALLVVALDVPQTFSELKALTSGFLGFALSFAMIVMLWRTHTRYFKRFALDDTTTLWLNSTLLFLVLFFVYPLKFLFTLLSSFFVGRATVFGDVRPMQLGDGPELMLLYGGGFFAVFLTFALMYVHALRKADTIGLSGPERAQTRTEAEALLLIALVGLSSIVVAFLPDSIAPFSGFVYFLIGPLLGFHGYFVGRLRLQRALDAETGPLAPEATALAAVTLPQPLPSGRGGSDVMPEASGAASPPPRQEGLGVVDPVSVISPEAPTHQAPRTPPPEA